VRFKVVSTIDLHLELASKIGGMTLLQAGRHMSIRIGATTTLSSLDDSLSLIQLSLTEHLNEIGTLDKLLRTGMSELIIDLEILGTRDHWASREELPYWKGCMTYPIKLSRSFALLGPLYMPELPASPCPNCLSRRWFNNRNKEEQRSIAQAQHMITTGHNPRVTTFILDTIRQVMMTALNQTEMTSKNEAFPFYVLDLETLRVSQHYLIQDSFCPVCTTVPLDSAEASRLHLTSRPKRQLSNYRLIKATDYELPIAGLINPISGVMGQMPIAEIVHTLASPILGQFEMRSSHGLHTIMWSGHGTSYYQSLYLGLLEATERYSGLLLRNKASTVYDSYEHLSSQALDPRTCGLYRPEFYQMSSDYLPFSPTRQLSWVWGYSFQQARPILVPEQLVYYMNYHHLKTNFVQECSSGCATGSCLEEAILYGLIELIERDAFLMTWYAQLAPPRINPRSSRCPETLFALEGIEKLGYELHLFDTRFDIRIPSILAVAKRKEPALANILVSAGAGLDPEDAIRSALCELACYIPDTLQRIESKVAQIEAMVQDYSKVTDLEHHPQLFASPKMAPHIDFLFQNPAYRSLEEAYCDWQDLWPRNQDLRDDLMACIGMIMQLGMDVIVVDQTCKEQALTGLKTVCVLVPGLLPMDFGWKKERIFDLPRLRTVPRTAGYRKADFEPDMQNIIPHPFP
jgi:ribosomal protein S12 methylthiotransferase accessory factor